MLDHDNESCQVAIPLPSAPRAATAGLIKGLTRLPCTSSIHEKSRERCECATGVSLLVVHRIYDEHLPRSLHVQCASPG